MTARQRALVQATWARVTPIADQAAALFYGRLFELDPKLRTLFHGDMEEQGRKLMTTLGLAVAALDDFEKIRPALASLGRRHDGYGVTDADYDTVGAALLWTLEQGLGSELTPEAHAAWAEVYATVASEMKRAQIQAAWTGDAVDGGRCLRASPFSTRCVENETSRNRSGGPRE